MWVAGGHTVTATAEWASMLPLENGYHQIVRGLSTETVTGPFGDFSMEPILEEIRESARNSSSPGSKAVFKLRTPKEIKGDDAAQYLYGSDKNQVIDKVKIFPIIGI